MAHTQRRAVTVVMALVLVALLAVPASAGQLIWYRGETSAPAPNRVFASVLKKESGRRFLRYIAFRTTLTCEDASTERFTVVVGIGRLREDGSFAREATVGSRGLHLRVDGTIGFRSGTGTWLFNHARLTEDGTDAQLCTTGELTWTVERTGAEPLRLPSASVPEGTGYLEVRVSTVGAPEVVELIQP